jgi:steroid delta-isomerase-like uncharacterized protein
MSTEENKAMVRRVMETYSKGQEASMAVLEELYGPDYVYHGPGAFGNADLAATKQMVRAFFTAFPEQHVTVEDLIAEGDKVVSRYTFRATHQGEFMGVPPTGKGMTVSGIMISRFAGGKWVEDWDSPDALSLMQQLGAIPPMPEPGV